MGDGDIALWLESQNKNPKTFRIPSPGGAVSERFFCPSESILEQTCLCMTPLSCVRPHTQICAHVKDPKSICRKTVGLTAGGIETRKHCTKGKKKSYVQWLLAFPWEFLNFLCIALGQDHDDNDNEEL